MTHLRFQKGELDISFSTLCNQIITIATVTASLACQSSLLSQVCKSRLKRSPSSFYQPRGFPLESVSYHGAAMTNITTL